MAVLHFDLFFSSPHEIITYPPARRFILPSKDMSAEWRHLSSSSDSIEMPLFTAKLEIILYN